MKTLFFLAMLSIRPAVAGEYDKQAFLALMNQRVPGYDQLDATHQAGWNALFIHYMLGDSQQYEQKKQNLIADWQSHNPDRQAENAIQYPSPLDNTAKQALITALAQRPPTTDGGQKSLDQILQETSPILMASLQPTPGGSAGGTNPNQTNTTSPVATAGPSATPVAGLDPPDVPDAPANPGDAVPGGPPDNAFTGRAPGSTAGGAGPGGQGGFSRASGSNSSPRTLSMGVENGAPSGELAAAAGTKSMASLKNKDAFGPDKRDDIDGAPTGRGPGQAGPRGPAGTGGPGAASSAYAGGASPAPAMGGRGWQGSAARPITVALAARSAPTSTLGPTVSLPRPTGAALPGAQTSSGLSGGSSPTQNPSLESSGPSSPEGAKETAKKRSQDAPKDLTEDEKKELAEIQQMLKEAAENGSLDPSSIEDSLAKSLGGGQTSLAMAELQSRIEDILRLSGSELTMQDKQEVYALAGQLGLSDAVAEKLVAAVQHGRLPSPQSPRRPMMRWQGFLLWLYGLWSQHSGLLFIGLALVGLICAAAANYLARDS